MDRHRAPVVAGVDGSRSGSNAAAWAAEEAVSAGRPLRLVYCFLVPAGHAGAGWRAIQREHGRETLDDEANRLRKRWPGLTVSTELEERAAAHWLVRQSETAALLVLGSHGLGGFTGMLLGSVAEAAAIHAKAPTVIVRGRRLEEPPPSDGPIVLGVDGSESNQDAIAFAFEYAARHDARLIAVHASHTPVIGRIGPLPPEFDPGEPTRLAERLLEETLAPWCAKHRELAVEQIVLEERPVRALSRIAETARLLVLGNRGRGGFSGMLLGSTSRALLSHAPCPLAVVHPHQLKEQG